MLLQKIAPNRILQFYRSTIYYENAPFSSSVFIRKLLKIQIYDSMRFTKILELETEIGHFGENDGHPWQRAEEMEERRGDEI